MSVKVRFAPSPTGKMHIGSVRTAVIVWLFAKKWGGEFLLRIDDTDQERSKEEYVDGLKSDLTWLGLGWDKFTRQKDRADIYAKYIQKLKDSGRLYACYETADELSLRRKVALSQGHPPTYDRASLKLTQADHEKLESEGRKPHWRFKLEHKPIVWKDLIRGEVKFEGKDLSDPVLIREDGTPLYHICSVIDDIDFNITHIMRGEDHVTNSATHIQMFEALGAQPPVFAHTSLISDADGAKLSKRIGSLSVEALREIADLEPMTILSMLARLGTSQPIEAFTTLDPLIESFDFSHFSRSPPKFDPDDLYRLNAKILQHMSYDQIKPKLDLIGMSAVDEQFWNAVRGNLKHCIDIKEWWKVANEPVNSVIADAGFISKAASLLPPAPWSDQTWKNWTDAVKTETGRKGKDLFMPLRQALTGMDHGPEMDVMLTLIGPEKARERLKTA